MIKQTILCVDDENDNLDALERIFRSKFKVLRALSGNEALKILDQYPEPVAVIITDQRMPQMTGVEFLEKSLAKNPDSIRILLTGYTDMESVVAAINTGQIYRYLNKPWDPIDLLNTVVRASERFQMACDIREKNIALEKANQDLSKALAELKILDQTKSQFMMLINHELKTPLTTIISFSDLLGEATLSEEQQVCLSRIRRSADRLKNLIDDSLVIVSAEMKTLKINTTTFDSKALVIKLDEHSEKAATRKHQSLQQKYIEKKTVGDPILISQVLNRLINNAVKFGDENVAIQIESAQIAPHRLKYSVINRGAKIPEAVKEKVMKPFFIDEDVLNHSSGTGLGLTVCQAILRAHSSHLQITNLENGVEASFELSCL